MASLSKDKSKKPWINRGNSRNTYRADLYDLPEWKAVRKIVFQNSFGLCALCDAKGIVKQATDIDHIKPVRAGGSLLSLSNLQALCSPCHASKSARESWMYGNRYNTKGGGGVKSLK